MLGGHKGTYRLAVPPARRRQLRTFIDTNKDAWGKAGVVFLLQA